MKTKLSESSNKAILIFIDILVTFSSQEFIKIKLAIIIVSLKVHFSPARSILFGLFYFLLFSDY